MNIILTSIRACFITLCVVLLATYAVLQQLPIVHLLGIVMAIPLMVLCEFVLKDRALKIFTVLFLGAFFGYSMGYMVSDTLAMSGIIKIFIPFGIAYLGMALSMKIFEEFPLKTSLTKSQEGKSKKGGLIIDINVLEDVRIIDLATTGIMDSHLIIPRFIIIECQNLLKSNLENIQTKAKRCLEIINKLEHITGLDLQYADQDFDDNDMTAKTLKLARSLGANILTTGLNQIDQSSLDSSIKIITLSALANALKPLMQTREFLQIKVQRYGKEPRQGIGYLDDGAMVVINGGAEYIGETIKVQVLSCKHSSSGRIIFCNAMEEDDDENYNVQEAAASMEDGNMEEDELKPIKITSPKDYFAM